MKRPQSAKPVRNYWGHPIVQESSPIMEEPIRHFAKAGKRQMFNAMSASNDLSRMLPKKIQQDKERLYCETLQLKTNLNEITQENLRLKTRIATLQKEKDRLNKTEEPLMGKGRSSNLLNLNSKNQKQNGMVSNLKKMIRQSREENETLNNEIAKLKRSIRYTKINEIEIEKQTVYEENKRLAKIVQNYQTELNSRVRQEDQLRYMENELDQKIKELKEVTSDNMRYEEILEEIQLKHKQTSEKLLIQERKWQRDFSVQRRKNDQLNRHVELLKQEVKVLTQQLAEEKKKNAQPKKVIRPSSSQPNQSVESASLRQKKNKEKEEAIQINEKLKHELQQAKRKLADSQNKLKVTDKVTDKTLDNNTKTNLAYSKDQTFQLILTKNEANQFMHHESQQDYDPDFEQNPSKLPKNINELPIEEKVKATVNRSNQNSTKNSQIMDEIRQILTFRMKYNRYPFEQLKADIEVSPLSSFSYEDLMNMLTAEPFFLTKTYTQQFLKVCYGKNKIKNDQNLDSAVLLKNLRHVIDDFELLDEDEEERSLYKIAEFMTKNRKLLQQQFKKIKDKNNCVTKNQLTQVLKSFESVTEEQINLAICYISLNTQNLQSINYSDLLDRFYINSSKQISNQNSKHIKNESELSMGENEDLDEGELIADDELV